jgi:hypothetical protein
MMRHQVFGEEKMSISPAHGSIDTGKLFCGAWSVAVVFIRLIRAVTLTITNEHIGYTVVAGIPVPAILALEVAARTCDLIAVIFV